MKIMKRTRIFSILLALLLLLQLSATCFAAETDETAAQSSEIAQESETSAVDGLPSGFEKPDAPNEYNFSLELSLQAKGAVLIELNSNSMVYQQDIDRQLYPASLTKIMTAMLALEYGDLDAVLTVSRSAMEGLSIYGSTAGLLVGEEITLREVLYCILVSSANEGCNVVAEYISGSVEDFVALMNEKAAELGMTGTHFANAHGLHDANHYTTVRDLATLACWAWKNPQFREFATTTRHTVPATNLSEERLLRTTNYLTDNRVVGRYYYDKASGIKTGFTTPAGGCLIATASDGDMTFLSVVCGCETVYDENGEAVDMRFTESKRLLKYALEKFSYVQVLSNTVMLEQLEVTGGQSDRVLVCASENVSLPLPLTADLSAITTELHYDTQGALAAPVQAGQKVGTVTAKYNGLVLASCDLVTLTAVESLSPVQTQAPSEEAEHGVSTPADGKTPSAKQEESVWSLLKRYWYLSVPFALVFVLVCWLLILRAVNVRRAKKRAQRRRERRRSRE